MQNGTQVLAFSAAAYLLFNSKLIRLEYKSLIQNIGRHLEFLITVKACLISSSIRDYNNKLYVTTVSLPSKQSWLPAEEATQVRPPSLHVRYIIIVLRHGSNPVTYYESEHKNVNCNQSENV